MNILSAEFLALTAVAVLVYYLLPLRFRWLALLAASGVFYAQAGWQAAVWLGAVTLLTWLGGMRLTVLTNHAKELKTAARSETPPDPRLRLRTIRRSRLLLALLLVLLFGSMAYIKYLPVVQQALTDVLAGGGLPLWPYLAPLGLSYFTFQAAGYVIDCYWGKAQAERNPLRVLLFLGWYPQITQGPISTWIQLGPQLAEGHRLNPDTLTSGFTLMLWGYFKKLVIADRLAPTTAALTAENPTLGYVTAACVALYLIRLYADFSGAMDMMRGISRLFGIDLPENFRQPLFSRSVAEFWRRWHTTLGAWFRTYVLYPLTTCRLGMAVGRLGTRLLGKKAGRQLPAALATVLIFLLIGIWHMATANAVVYGLYFGVLMAVSMLLEPLWKLMRQTLSLPEGSWMTPLRLIRTWALLWVAQFFALTASPGAGLRLLREVFLPAPDGLARLAELMPALEWLIAGIGLALMLLVDLRCAKKPGLADRLAGGSLLKRWPALLFLIFATLIFGVYGTGFDSAAFVYAGF